MFCAHCGGRMTSNMNTERYTVKSTGEVKEKHYLRYICYHRSRKLCDCDGQSVYSAEKVDKAVINEMEQKKASMEKVRPMYDMFKGWAEEFRMATIEQKKMIISQVISRIEIGKGYKINITLNMEYEQFCVGWNGLNNL